MIAIIDYGLGNINAFINVFNRIGVPVKIASAIDDLDGSTKIILPGVGAFDHAMKMLEESGLRPRLDNLVMNRRLPIIGICVGMQILARSSEEGILPGLGYVDGIVKRFDPSKILQTTRLPHMGWNSVRPKESNGLFKSIEKDTRFYFLHSYYFECFDQSDVLATTDYGGDFSSAIRHGNIYGVQFHPEKSHSAGVRLLQNFAEL